MKLYFEDFDLNLPFTQNICVRLMPYRYYGKYRRASRRGGGVEGVPGARAPPPYFGQI